MLPLMDVRGWRRSEAAGQWVMLDGPIVPLVISEAISAYSLTLNDLGFLHTVAFRFDFSLF